MNIKPLRLGELIAEIPIIQGGMGVGVSRANLAAAVANEGGIGVISSAQIGYDEIDFPKNPLLANIRALKKHIMLAKEKAKRGLIGLNIMVALKNYEVMVKAAIEAGVDLIISGAGLPTSLPGFTKGSKVKLAPIVSSSKAARTILKFWDRKYDTTADMVVIEGPRAGGHLGYSLEELNQGSVDLDQIVVDVIQDVKEYENKYEKHIPIVVGGGIYTGTDIAHYLNLGANGVQMATRFIGTHECDADIKYKEAFLNVNKDKIEIIKSPVGMPGRAITNSFIDTIKKDKIKVKKCHQCLNDCDTQNIPYCITEALINAVKGDVQNGLIFCGDNAYRVKEIVSVKDIFRELKTELLTL